jgi:hypothetical protein
MQVVPFEQQQALPLHTCGRLQHRGLAPVVQACGGACEQHTPWQVVMVLLFATHAPPQKTCPVGQVQPLQVALGTWFDVHATQVVVPPAGVQGVVPVGHSQVQFVVLSTWPPVQLATHTVLPALVVHTVCPVGQVQVQVAGLKVVEPAQVEGTQVPLVAQKVVPGGQTQPK